MVNFFEMVGASFTLVLALMSILWVVYYFIKNSGLVDIGLACGFVLAAWAYFFLGEGYTPKRWVIMIMVTIWGLRLAWHMYQRFVTLGEDPRYEEIRKSWGDENSDFKFFMMFIFQGVLVVILSLPFLIVSGLAVPGWSGIEIFAVVLWMLSVAGETLADHQLTTFKQKPENQGKVCKEGLWRFSRHPNYFFEFLIWVSYFLFALGTPAGWLSILSPILMLFLLLKVSGIPLNEAETAKSKGPEYEEYQKTTNPFIPWFPKK